jgi:DNA-directed RNA polymerase subunit K/omega
MPKGDKQVDKRHVSVTPVDLQDMTQKGESIYQAIAVTARRARQINDEIKQEYQARISTLVPVELDDDEDFEATNFDQLKISLEIDKMGKPTLEATDEFLANKLEFRFRDRD